MIVKITTAFTVIQTLSR